MIFVTSLNLICDCKPRAKGLFSWVLHIIEWPCDCHNNNDRLDRLINFKYRLCGTTANKFFCCSYLLQTANCIPLFFENIINGDELLSLAVSLKQTPSSSNGSRLVIHGNVSGWEIQWRENSGGCRQEVSGSTTPANSSYLVYCFVLSQ